MFDILDNEPYMSYWSNLESWSQLLLMKFLSRSKINNNVCCNQDTDLNSMCTELWFGSKGKNYSYMVMLAFLDLGNTVAIDSTINMMKATIELSPISFSVKKMALLHYTWRIWSLELDFDNICKQHQGSDVLRWSSMIVMEGYLTPVTRPICRGNSKSFQRLQARIQCYKYSIFPRTIPDWNNLQENIIQSSSTQAFKQHLQAQ